MKIFSQETYQKKIQYWVRIKLWGMDIAPTSLIDRTAYIDRTYPNGIHIADNTYIGPEAVVLTHDFTRGIYLNTFIGARTNIGARAIVMPGVSIGEDCLVHPGALVNRDMPAMTEALGNPARISPREIIA